MDRQEFRDNQWAIIESFVPGGRKGKCGPRNDGRKFINALLWLARSGERWRDISPTYGQYQTIKMRYDRWLDKAIIEAIVQALIKDAEMDWIQRDGTVIHAHKHAASAILSASL